MRITFAVPFLVVEFRQVLRLDEIARIRYVLHSARYDLTAVDSVHLHHLEILIRQLVLTVQYPVGDLDLADVVERRRVDHVGDVFVSNDVRVVSKFAQTLEDDTGICRGLPDVISGALVTALHHVCEDENDAALHLGDRVLLVLYIVDVLDAVFGCFNE